MIIKYKNFSFQLLIVFLLLFVCGGLLLYQAPYAFEDRFIQLLSTLIFFVALRNAYRLPDWYEIDSLSAKISVNSNDFQSLVKRAFTWKALGKSALAINDVCEAIKLKNEDPSINLLCSRLVTMDKKVQTAAVRSICHSLINEQNEAECAKSLGDAVIKFSNVNSIKTIPP